MGPNASISGRCKIDEFVLVGVGATIIDPIVICFNVVIRAGSVVVQKIAEPGTYIGSAAKRNR